MNTDNDVRATDITVDEYLNQRDFWLDENSGQLVPIDSLSDARRLYASRALIRNATALISLVENERNRNRDLAGVMGLVSRNPKEFVTSSPLYGRLYRDERGEPVTSGVMGPGAQINFSPPRT